MIREEHIAVQRTARYYVLGEAGASVRQVWFVLHGFGQLAGRFIRHFEPVGDDTRVIVAPEALSRYYLDSTSLPATERRVGATWMTKEDREREIADYVGYLDALAARVLGTVDRERVEVLALGFSQGAATASRWAAMGATRVDRLVLWAGTLPPDLDLRAHAAPLGRARLAMVVGSRDDLLRPESVEQAERRLQAHAIPYRAIRFGGGHHLDAGVLRELAAS